MSSVSQEFASSQPNNSSEIKQFETSKANPKKKSQHGRPSVSLEDKRKVRSIKMADWEWQEIQIRAAEAKESASGYIRRIVLGSYQSPHK